MRWFHFISFHCIAAGVVVVVAGVGGRGVVIIIVRRLDGIRLVGGLHGESFLT